MNRTKEFYLYPQIHNYCKFVEDTCRTSNMIKIAMFVWLGFYNLLENFETSRFQVKAGLQILTFARHPWLLIEQWGLFSMPHLLWVGAFVYNGHIWGPMTLTPVAEVFQWSCHYPFLWLRSVVAGIWTFNLLHVRQTL